MSRPKTVYGPAQEWPRTGIEERVARGQRVVDSVADTEWRDVPVVGSVVAGILSLLILAVWWARDGLTTDYTAGLLLLPVASGFGIILALATWERVLRRHSWTIAVTIGLVLAAVGVGLLTWLVWGTRGEVVATGSVFWLAACRLHTSASQRSSSGSCRARIDAPAAGPPA
ncbi:hypothetical protein BJF82_13245 [Kytococcus sp. CUA-901]|nr:hypothetical protein BJF82_13245 [Kytococcus sp. CUA-901]